MPGRADPHVAGARAALNGGGCAVVENGNRKRRANSDLSACCGGVCAQFTGCAVFRGKRNILAGGKQLIRSTERCFRPRAGD